MENQNQNGTQVPAQSPTIADRMVVTVKGQDGNEVKITKRILMDTVCRGMQISDADMVQFLTLCQVNQLNPFLREAYLVKYGTQPAQMITAKDAFMKRADRCQDYEGLESGVIGINEQNVIQDFEGAFLPPKWTLIGGWAKVYRHGRRPYVQRVSFSEYNKSQSTWKQMPLTMIRKVAEVQALREAFPNNLSGLYVSEETADNRYVDVTDQVDQEKKHNANRETIGFGDDKDEGRAPSPSPGTPVAYAAAPQRPNPGTPVAYADAPQRPNPGTSSRRPLHRSGASTPAPEGVDPETGEILTQPRPSAPSGAPHPSSGSLFTDSDAPAY